ncbi:MAG: queuosine precursor transporter [Candidatus Melainabacteria bacterium]|nr:queuosine precursor transporter [Candidatus Melainabacteria bacterium]
MCTVLFNAITALYVAILVLVPSVASKFIALGPVNISGATLFFPVTYIFNDILTEVYGYSRSRQIIWLGFAAQILTAFAYWLVGIMPAAPFWHNQTAYDTILGIAPRITLASLMAYIMGEFVNSVILSRLKFAQGGQSGIPQASRFVLSTIAGEAVDSIVFLGIAFYGTMAFKDLVETALTIYVAKVLYEIVALPVSMRLAQYLKRVEHVDQIDNPSTTNYSPFNLH